MPAADIREVGGANRVGPIDLALLAEPLDFILADHLRQRTLCDLLDRLADESGFDAALAWHVVEHLTNDMAVHVVDEEEDLFPLLRRRAEPADQIERVLGLLSREHAEDERLGRTLIEELQGAIAAGAARLDGDVRLKLRQFAHRHRRHIAVENAIVMPLAELRLARKDRETLARRMAARRGIELRKGRT